MEEDVLNFRRFAEDLLPAEKKCASTVFEDCDSSNYDACESKLPSPHCSGGIEFSSEDCGGGTKCAAIYGFSTSVLRLAPGSYDPLTREPTDKVSLNAPYRMSSKVFYHHPRLHSLDLTILNEFYLVLGERCSLLLSSAGNSHETYTEQSLSLWKQYKLNPPPMFYGSSTGIFRIYPGHPKKCKTVIPSLGL
jgi:hypothetical protein